MEVGPTCRCGWALLFLLLAIKSVNSLRDDWYSFSSFEDTAEWESTFSYTCSFKIDLFREPRELTERNSLQARQELHTPIRFRSKDAIFVNGTQNLTLHVYANPGIRKGYSVAYGFQRNKECLHGQDAECVVHPEIGSVRALVVSAERFEEKRNLNFIKDHFLIEKSEQFVTILNAGSIYERKFYEAVFLGGPSQDPARTSHEIDGKTYPLEIYMFFLDETVPSVSLATILVVLVEESDRDNPQIKPIISAIESHLYNDERRFLETNPSLIRRERLFHHLRASTYYDVFDTGHYVERGELILHEPLDSSAKHEAIFTRFVEPFEKMQALEAELFFLLEDLENVERDYEALEATQDGVYHRREKKLFPGNNTEMQILALVPGIRGFVDAEKLRKKKARKENITQDCYDYAIEKLRDPGDFFNEPPLSDFRDLWVKSDVNKNDDHRNAFMVLITALCEHYDRNLYDIYEFNQRNISMRTISVEDKYQLIQRFKDERLYGKFYWPPKPDALAALFNTRGRQHYNKLIYKHFADPIFHPPGGNENPEYSSDRQPFELADGLYKMLLRLKRLENFKRVREETRRAILKTATRLEFASIQTLNNIVQYLRQGSKTNDLKYHRSKIFEDFVNRQLPAQKKKRTLVEYGGMEVAEDVIKKYEELNPIKVTVDQAFQISWLMPPNGGYYYYHGSSPIPPCFRAQNVLVFKKPIKMSKRQIETLTRVPTSFYRQEDIRSTAPRIHDTRFEVDLSGADTEKSRVEEIRAPVYFQPRNHLFMGHDGFHKNAVAEWERLNAIKKRKKNVGAGRVKGTGMLTMLAATMIAFLYHN